MIDISSRLGSRRSVCALSTRPTSSHEATPRIRRSAYRGCPPQSFARATTVSEDTSKYPRLLTGSRRCRARLPSVGASRRALFLAHTTKRCMKGEKRVTAHSRPGSNSPAAWFLCDHGCSRWELSRSEWSGGKVALAEFEGIGIWKDLVDLVVWI